MKYNNVELTKININYYRMLGWKFIMSHTKKGAITSSLFCMFLNLRVVLILQSSNRQFCRTGTAEETRRYEYLC